VLEKAETEVGGVEWRVNCFRHLVFSVRQLSFCSPPIFIYALAHTYTALTLPHLCACVCVSGFLWYT